MNFSPNLFFLILDQENNLLFDEFFFRRYCFHFKEFSFLRIFFLDNFSSDVKHKNGETKSVISLKRKGLSFTQIRKRDCVL